MRIREVLIKAAEKISSRWPDTPFLDAQVLLKESAGITREQLLASFSEELQESVLDRFEVMVDKRVSGYPVAYITGKKEFYSRNFIVDKSVLIPRSDTEILVEKVIKEVKKMTSYLKGNIKILDLCTGSGCIAVTLKSELGSIAEVQASDISPDAEKTFYINCENILGYRLPFTRSSLLDSINDKFHIIASNPPYLDNEQVEDMRSKNWPEPELALRGGTDGLDFIKEIIRTAHLNLKSGGMLCMEADSAQMNMIKTLFIENNYKEINIEKDLAGRERVISGCLK